MRTRISPDSGDERITMRSMSWKASLPAVWQRSARVQRSHLPRSRVDRLVERLPRRIITCAWKRTPCPTTLFGITRSIACAAYSLSRTSWRERLRSVRRLVYSSLSALVELAIQSATVRPNCAPA
jgi:hypothetical protein